MPSCDGPTNVGDDLQVVMMMDGGEREHLGGGEVTQSRMPDRRSAAAQTLELRLESRKAITNDLDLVSEIFNIDFERFGGSGSSSFATRDEPDEQDESTDWVRGSLSRAVLRQ